jgi:hypothetical protein
MPRQPLVLTVDYGMSFALSGRTNVPALPGRTPLFVKVTEMDQGRKR